MNVLLIFLITIAVFILGYRFYARYIEKIFDEQGDKILEKKLEERDKLIEELYRQIGQLKVELDWLKKKLNVI